MFISSFIYTKSFYIFPAVDILFYYMIYEELTILNNTTGNN